MTQPFSLEVTSDSWLSSAHAWIAEALAECSIGSTGEIKQERVRPWATVMSIPTSVGTCWFKAACPAMAFEPALAAELSRLEPEHFEPPLAIEVKRGWQLMTDHGPTLNDSGEVTAELWRSVLKLAATVQRHVAGHGAEMLATGLPDMSPHTVPARFDRLLHLLPAAPAALAPDEHELDLLEHARTAVAAAAAVLAASSVPSSWQHGDMHPGNVVRRHGSLRLVDLGDGQWAHPAEALVVPRGVVLADELDWNAISPAWRDAWGLSAEEFTGIWRAASITQAVNRTATWLGALEYATAEELTRWAPNVRTLFVRLIDLCSDHSGGGLVV